MTEISVLFVCLGNICRSPTAEGVFRSKVARAGLQDQLKIDSAGTGDWHIGRAPDSRAQEYAAQAGYDLSNLRARLVSADDFDQFDYILAMDEQNLRDLQSMQPPDFNGYLGLFLEFDSGLPMQEVPDPYSMGAPAFRNAIQLIECGCDALIEEIQARLQQAS